MKRRAFLRTAIGAGMALPALWAQSGCAPRVIAKDGRTGLSLCYVAGDVTADGAIVWLRADPGSEVSLYYGKDPNFSQVASLGPFRVDESADHTLQFALDGLEPATTYYYFAVVSGRQPGYVGRFVTAPRPDDATRVSFCFSGDTRESYQPFTIMKAVRAQQPDFFLHLGDTIYADFGGRARQLPEFWAKYRANRNDGASQSCFFETSVYAVWDDHEVVNNYGADHPLAPIGQKAFLDYWPVRRHAAEAQRVYRAARWGKGMELFILDGRQYREPRHDTMLGQAQKRWLLQGLADSTAIFKFVATSVPMAGGGRDRWDGYPEERAEILRFIRERKVSGVVFLSADLHYAAITKIPRSGGLRDITAGPLAAPLNPITNGLAPRFEFFRAENFNFAKVTVDPASTPAHALVEFIDQDNQVFYSTRIAANR